MTEGFYRKVLKIALPIALSQFLGGLMSVVDTLMVSQLGDNAVAAVGIASNIAFFMFMVNWGLLSGFGIFIAQYYGSKDIFNIHKVFIIVLGFSTTIALVFFSLAFFFPEALIGLYTQSSDTTNVLAVRAFGIRYLKIVSISYITITFTQMLSILMRSVEDVVIPQIIQISVIFINTGLNFILINGRLGFEAYGVAGAAYATVISSSLGLITFFVYMRLKNSPIYNIQWSAAKAITRPFTLRILKKTMPVLANETFWGLGMSMYLIAFGFISPLAITSLTIANQIMGLIWFANGGVSAATAIMLGHKLGDNQLGEAKIYAKRFVRINIVLGLSIGILLFTFSRPIAQIYTATSESVQENVVLFLRIYAVYLPVKFMNALHIVGTLRSGGDTFYALLSELLPLWLYGVPIAFILALTTSLPLPIILILMNVEELIKFVLLITRYKSYRWIKNLTFEEPTKVT